MVFEEEGVHQNTFIAKSVLSITDSIWLSLRVLSSFVPFTGRLAVYYSILVLSLLFFPSLFFVLSHPFWIWFLLSLNLFSHYCHKKHLNNRLIIIILIVILHYLLVFLVFPKQNEFSILMSQWRNSVIPNVILFNSDNDN